MTLAQPARLSGDGSKGVRLASLPIPTWSSPQTESQVAEFVDPKNAATVRQNAEQAIGLVARMRLNSGATSVGDQDGLSGSGDRRKARGLIGMAQIKGDAQGVQPASQMRC